MLTLTKDIVIADSLYAEKIIFLPSLGHHSMDIIVGVNLGGLGQRIVQVSSEYKMRRRIFEPPPPTAQTEQARNLKFGMVGP